MMVTVSEFLGMALDSTFEFSIYDFAKGKNIFGAGRMKKCQRKWKK